MVVVHQQINVSRILDESARWWLTKGRYTEAEAIISRAARMNKRELSKEMLDMRNKSLIDMQKVVLKCMCVYSVYVVVLLLTEYWGHYSKKSVLHLVVICGLQTFPVCYQQNSFDVLCVSTFGSLVKGYVHSRGICFNVLGRR